MFLHQDFTVSWNKVTSFTYFMCHLHAQYKKQMSNTIFFKYIYSKSEMCSVLAVFILNMMTLNSS